MTQTRVDLKLHGVRELQQALQSLGAQVAGRLGANAVRAGARAIVARAKTNAPIKTGALRRSIRVFTDRGEARLGGATRTAYAGTRLYYGWFLEFGTQHIAPRSFLRRALDEAAQEAVNKMADNLSKGIAREVAKRGAQ